jgi:hypothetical protein
MSSGPSSAYAHTPTQQNPGYGFGLPSQARPSSQPSTPLSLSPHGSSFEPPRALSDMPPPPPKSSLTCSCKSVMPELASPWSWSPPPWPRHWTDEEIRREEQRRLVWTALLFVANYSSQSVVFGGSERVAKLFLSEPSNVSCSLPCPEHGRTHLSFLVPSFISRRICRARCSFSPLACRASFSQRRDVAPLLSLFIAMEQLLLEPERDSAAAGQPGPRRSRRIRD